MHVLNNKQILVGVTGAIAAYKSAELVRQLRRAGAQVKVAMTANARTFIMPLTLQAVSGHPVHTQMSDADRDAGMEHIELARWADVIIVAPASANFIARLRIGMADDLLTSLCLATSSPVHIAPAMNQQMWQNPATQDNITVLRERGIAVLGPDSGDQACGEYGPGRMLEPDALISKLNEHFTSGSLAGITMLVTAGPTHEPIDPVRYITNRSSGRMGYAVAQAALEAGAKVTLVSGPVSLTPPERARIIRITTAKEMHNAVMEHVTGADILIAAAAVADYGCDHVAGHKIKKDGNPLSLVLNKTRDVLAQVAGLNNPPYTVGFAAETEQLKNRAREKLVRKKLNLIAANWVDNNRGFEQEENALTVLWPGGEMELATATKPKLARRLIKIIAERYHAERTT